MITIQSGKYKLKFRFVAGTSRGQMTERDTWLVRISDNTGHKYGIGECAPLPGLSIDALPDFDDILKAVCRQLELYGNEHGISEECLFQIDRQYPSIKMGFETAIRDYINGGNRLLFNNGFYEGVKKIPINGLIWMGDRSFISEQIEQKLADGYSCIKMKIGAMDIETELDILKNLRKRYGPEDLTIRVDANGAFSIQDVDGILDRLSKLKVHSIEQPIMPVYYKELSDLCRSSPVPIALDESLAGHGHEKNTLLAEIRPAYIVLKPTLLGGFSETSDWIRTAENNHIRWWITSALESNIGLNALCQFTSEFRIDMEQGLGTGQLFHNNFESPLRVGQGQIRNSNNGKWDLAPLNSLFG